MADFTTILINLSESLEPFYRLVVGAAYLIGLVFFYKSLVMLKVYGNQHSYNPSRGNFTEAMIYLGVASIFLFLPTALRIFSTTLFGFDSPLAYSDWVTNLTAKYGDVTKAILWLTKVAGLIWFIHGWIIIASKKPGQQQKKQGKKGIIYIVAGIMSMNAMTTTNFLSEVMRRIAAGTLGAGPS